MASLSAPPNLIVSSRLADARLWVEVLNLGGFNVLVTPFETEEVLRVTFAAWHNWECKKVERSLEKRGLRSARLHLQGNIVMPPD